MFIIIITLAIHRHASYTKKRYSYQNKKIYFGCKRSSKETYPSSYSTLYEDVPLMDMAQDDDIVASSVNDFEKDPTDMLHDETQAINEDESNSPLHIHEAAYINNCIGFDTTGNKIPNELMGQWCFNLSNANKPTQSQVPKGTSGKKINIKIHTFKF